MGYMELGRPAVSEIRAARRLGISNDMKVLQDSEDPPRAAVELSAIASPGRWQRWRPRWAAWMRWCSTGHRRELAGDPRPDRRASRVAGRQRGQRANRTNAFEISAADVRGAGFRGADQRRKMIARYTITVLGESMASA